jgi:hypothetical protein
MIEFAKDITKAVIVAIIGTSIIAYFVPVDQNSPNYTLLEPTTSRTFTALEISVNIYRQLQGTRSFPFYSWKSTLTFNAKLHNKSGKKLNNCIMVYEAKIGDGEINQFSAYPVSVFTNDFRQNSDQIEALIASGDVVIDEGEGIYDRSIHYSINATPSDKKALQSFTVNPKSDSTIEFWANGLRGKPTSINAQVVCNDSSITPIFIILPENFSIEDDGDFGGFIGFLLMVFGIIAVIVFALIKFTRWIGRVIFHSISAE